MDDMRWLEVHKIPDVNSEIIAKDYLLFYEIASENKYKFRILNINDFSEVAEFHLERDYEFKYDGKDAIYFSCNNEIRRYSIENESMSSILKMDVDYITVISSSLFIASTYDIQTKSYRNTFVDQDGTPINACRGYESFIEHSSDYVISINKLEEMIGLFDTKNKNYRWQNNVPNELSGNSLSSEGKILLYHSNTLSAFDLESGGVLWTLNDPPMHLQVDDRNGKLFGLKDHAFKIFDINYGNILLTKELCDDFHIPSNLTFLHSDGLYFSGFRSGNVPIFGSLHTKDGQLEFFQELEVEGSKSLRNGLGRPALFEDKLCIKDGSKTLHIFEGK